MQAIKAVGGMNANNGEKTERYQDMRYARGRRGTYIAASVFRLPQLAGAREEMSVSSNVYVLHVTFVLDITF